MQNVNSYVVSAALAAALLSPFAMADDRAGEEPVRFDDHKLVEVDLQTQRELRTMTAIGATPWACRVGLGEQQYSVSPEQRELLERAGIDYDVLVENVQELFDQEQQQINALRAQAGTGWFDVFRTLPEIDAYIDELIDLRPDLIERSVVGYSHNDRPIHAMRITGTGGPEEKPAVLFNGCQHAREWIAVMAPMYIADQLVRNYDSSPEIQDIMDKVEFFIVPVVNPDGYDYTYAPNGNRMWRKNRRDNGGGVYGVDNNRNWDIDWNGGNSTSTNPSSDTYVGPAPMSEPETQAMAQFILDRPQIQAHVDFHSYSQLVLEPWSYTTAPPPDQALLSQLGSDMSDAIFDVHGETYAHGTAGDLLYFASGVMPDWCYDQRGIFGYTIEMRPTSPFPGFILPPEEIIPTAEENFAAAMTMAEFVSAGVSFSFPNGRPDFASDGVAAPVEVHMQAVTSGPIDESTAVLKSRTGTGSFIETPMTAVGGGLFEGALPAASCGQTIEYYIEVESEDGMSYTSPADAPDSVYETPVVEIVLEDTFDTDLGWTVGAPDDDATAGIWERVDPIGTSTGGQQVQPDGPYTGSACYITGQHFGSGAGSSDVDNGKTTLFSPVLDLSDADDATISYRRWFSNNAGAGPNTDAFVVDISNNGGQTWQNVETVGPNGPEVSGGWFAHEFSVASIVTPTAQVQLRFVASDEDPQSLVEAGVDAFVVVQDDCEIICPSDLTGDGTVNVSDMLALLGTWGSCDSPCPGDLNGDESVNVSDLLILLGEWGSCSN